MFDIWIGDRCVVLNGRLRQLICIPKPKQYTDPTHKGTEEFRTEQVIVSRIEVLAINDYSRLRGVRQQRPSRYGEPTRSIGFHGCQRSQSVNRLHITDGNGEAEIVAFRESNAEISLVKRHHLTHHYFLSVCNGVELNTLVSSAKLRCEIIADDGNAIGIIARHMVLITIVAITLLVVGTGVVQRVRTCILDSGINDCCFRAGASHPATTQIRCVIKSTSWIGRWINGGHSRTGRRFTVAYSQTHGSNRKWLTICWINKRINVAIESQRHPIERSVITNRRWTK